jgi:hypothetical protein
MEQQVANSGLQETIAAYQNHITAMETSCATTKDRVSRANELLQRVDLGRRIVEAQVLVHVAAMSNNPKYAIRSEC